MPQDILQCFVYFECFFYTGFTVFLFDVVNIGGRQARLGENVSEYWPWKKLHATSSQTEWLVNLPDVFINKKMRVY